jgi:glycerate 2-kinase
MAAALDEAWPDVDVSGIVVTRYGHAVPAGRIEILEAAHPVPDEASQQAAKRILEALDQLSPDDLVVALILGGGSSLMALPIEGVTLGQKIEIHRALISSGATITEINTVRKCLSAVKGGRLALACQPARLVTLVVNDIPGDDLSLVASGPTMRSEIAIEEVEAIVDRYRIDLCGVPRSLLTNGPKVPAHFEQDVRVVACPWDSLLAASSVARASAIDPVILGDAIEGESSEVAKVMAGLARAIKSGHASISPPAVLISGDETSVSLPAKSAGRGGRNTEFILSFALAMRGEACIWAISGDTDGIDGTEDFAGAIASPDTLRRCAHAGLNARRSLAEHDSFAVLDAIGDLIRTGPTHTNVNGFRAILIG